jgi:hypothetical protein
MAAAFNQRGHWNIAVHFPRVDGNHDTYTPEFSHMLPLSEALVKSLLAALDHHLSRDPKSVSDLCVVVRIRRNN